MTIGAFTAATDTGRKRRRNEDAYVLAPPLFAVADGMGGAQAGEVASKLAAAALSDTDPGSLSGTERVTTLFQEANRRVYERSATDPAVSGMGTTMTVALVEGGEVVIGHVGDSRAYRLRDGRIEQLTDDHSLVNELIKSGKLSPEEAETHPQRAVITRALGTDPDVDVDAFAVPAQEGDVFLICSDGLTTMVDDEDILALLESNLDDLPKAGKALVAAANRQRRRGQHHRRRVPDRRSSPRAGRGRGRDPDAPGGRLRAGGHDRRRAGAGRRGGGRARPHARGRPHAARADDGRPARPRRDPARLGAGALSYRNRELLNLVAVGVLTAVGFASVYISEQSKISGASLTYAVFFLALYLAAHIVARVTVPRADPYLLPLAGLLTAVGLTEIYRLGPANAFKQGLWIVIAVAVFAGTLIWLRRDYRVLENYKYLFGLSAIALLFMPLLPGIGQTVNGARLWIHFGGLQFQPGELGKIALIVFLAAYLREKREVLAQGRLKDWGPLLVIWGAAMMVLFVTADLGSALLYYGIFLAMLYLATARLSFVAVGLGLFLAGSVAVYKGTPHVRDRVTNWLHPWTTHLVYCPLNGGRALRQDCQSYQEVQSLYSIAHGGFGGTGLGSGTFTNAAGQPDHPGPQHRLHLLGARAGARSDRRGRARAPLHGVRAARVPRRADGRRRLLEAARGRADVRPRAADVHHHRRDPARDPAHRDHAAARLVRRLERALELPRARGADARLRPGQP